MFFFFYYFIDPSIFFLTADFDLTKNVTLTLGESINLQIDGIDIYMNKLYFGSDAFTGTLLHENGTVVPGVTIVSLCNGSYQVNAQPTESGNYTLLVNVGCGQFEYRLYKRVNITVNNTFWIFFDDTGSRLTAIFLNRTNMPGQSQANSSGNFDCSLIIENFDVLGEDSFCSWLDPFILTIFLGNNRSVIVGDKIFFRKDGVFKNPDGSPYTGEGAYTLPDIGYVKKPGKGSPYLTIEAPEIINNCQIVEFSVKYSWNLGARDVYWNWTIKEGPPNYQRIADFLKSKIGPVVTFSADLAAQLFLPSHIYEFRVETQNHLSFSNSLTFAVQVSIDSPPSIISKPSLREKWSLEELKLHADIEISGCIPEQTPFNVFVLWTNVEAPLVEWYPAQRTANQKTLVVSPKVLLSNQSYNLEARSTNTKILPAFGSYIHELDVVQKKPHFYIEHGTRRLFPLGERNLEISLTDFVDYDDKPELPFHFNWTCQIVDDNCTNHYRQFIDKTTDYYYEIGINPWKSEIERTNPTLPNCLPTVPLVPCFDEFSNREWLLDSPVLNIPSYAFGIGAFNFTVTVGKEGGLTTTKSIFIQTNGSSPQVYVDVREIRREKQVSRNSQLVLEGKSLWDPRFGEASYTWSVPTNNLNLSDPRVTTSPITRPYLIINRNVLGSHSYYVFRLEVETSEGIGWAEYSFVSNDPPTGGASYLKPGDGALTYAYIDSVTLSCVQFEDWDTHFKFKYFMQLPSVFNSSQVELFPLHPGFWYSNELSLLLPLGVSNFVIEIYDRFEEAFTTQFLSTTTFPGNSLIPSRVSKDSLPESKNRLITDYTPMQIATQLSLFLNQSLINMDTKDIGIYTLYIIEQINLANDSLSQESRSFHRKWLLDIIRWTMRTEIREEIILYKLKYLARIMTHPNDLDLGTLEKISSTLSDLLSKSSRFQFSKETMRYFFFVIDRLLSSNNFAISPQLAGALREVFDLVIPNILNSITAGETAEFSGEKFSFLGMKNVRGTMKLGQSFVTLPPSINSILGGGDVVGETPVLNNSLSLFQWNFDVNTFARNSTNVTLPVLSISIFDGTGKREISNLTQNVLIGIPFNSSAYSTPVERTCLYFNGTHYTTDGCQVVSEEAELTICSCSHFTDFAVSVSETAPPVESTTPPATPPRNPLLNKVEIMLIVIIGGIALLFLILMAALRYYFGYAQKRDRKDKKVVDDPQLRLIGRPNLFPLVPGGDYNRIENAQKRTAVKKNSSSSSSSSDSGESDNSFEFYYRDFDNRSSSVDSESSEQSRHYKSNSKSRSVKRTVIYTKPSFYGQDNEFNEESDVSYYGGNMRERSSRSESIRGGNYRERSSHSESIRGGNMKDRSYNDDSSYGGKSTTFTSKKVKHVNDIDQYFEEDKNFSNDSFTSYSVDAPKLHKRKGNR